MVTWTKEQFIAQQAKLHQKVKDAYDDKTKYTRTNAAPKPGVIPTMARGAKDEASGSIRVGVRITSVRKRLCDPDALLPKWHIDGLRFLGFIADDSAKHITLEVGQRKTERGEEEHTEITLTYP